MYRVTYICFGDFNGLFLLVHTDSHLTYILILYSGTRKSESFFAQLIKARHYLHLFQYLLQITFLSCDVSSSWFWPCPVSEYFDVTQEEVDSIRWWTHRLKYFTHSLFLIRTAESTLTPTLIGMSKLKCYQFFHLCHAYIRSSVIAALENLALFNCYLLCQSIKLRIFIVTHFTTYFRYEEWCLVLKT